VPFGARAFGTYGATHCALLPLLCGLLPLMDELACRCATFINGCLGSDCEVVNLLHITVSTLESLLSGHIINLSLLHHITELCICF